MKDSVPQLAQYYRDGATAPCDIIYHTDVDINTSGYK